MNYLNEQRNRLPHRKKEITAFAGYFTVLKEWHHNGPSGRQVYGYVAVGTDGVNLVVKSFFDRDCPSPAEEEGVFIDGIPLARNQTRVVSRDSEIGYIGDIVPSTGREESFMTLDVFIW